MAAFARFAQFKCHPSRNNFFTECNKIAQKAAQGKLFGASAVQCKHVAAKRRLHRSKTIELVQNNFCRCVPFEFNDNTHTCPVAFVLNMGDAFDLFLAHLLRNFFNHRSFVHLIGNFFDDNRIAVFANFLDPRLCADDNAAASFKIRFACARSSQD